MTGKTLSIEKLQAEKWSKNTALLAMSLCSQGDVLSDSEAHSLCTCPLVYAFTGAKHGSCPTRDSAGHRTSPSPSRGRLRAAQGRRRQRCILCGHTLVCGLHVGISPQLVPETAASDEFLNPSFFKKKTRYRN